MISHRNYRGFFRSFLRSCYFLRFSTPPGIVKTLRMLFKVFVSTTDFAVFSWALTSLSRKDIGGRGSLVAKHPEKHCTTTPRIEIRTIFFMIRPFKKYYRILIVNVWRRHGPRRLLRCSDLSFLW